MLTNVEIQNIIPHRYPFLLVDKILEVEPGKKAVGIKNVSANEPYFQGHFPGNPIMPGVLQVEALAQVVCVAGLLMEENKGKLGMFTGFENIKFKRPVVPGDVLRLEGEIVLLKMGMGKAKVVATVEDQVTVEGEIKFALVDPQKIKK
jgi:3-hydroxyacyl-[acyl-carrier-protein] dehydratase